MQIGTSGFKCFSIELDRFAVGQVDRDLIATLARAGDVEIGFAGGSAVFTGIHGFGIFREQLSRGRSPGGVQCRESHPDCQT